ncbi:hypothetical protein FQN57_007032 [Myotisia sp. PD_48]|nr:hypothetical protein FQN57_007032 [Myotisia sp. PD_48]
MPGFSASGSENPPISRTSSTSTISTNFQVHQKVSIIDGAEHQQRDPISSQCSSQPTLNNQHHHQQYQDEKSKYEVSSDGEDIQYHYLSFASQLPSPCTDRRVDLETTDVSKPKPEAPPCPDLTEYISPFEWSVTRKALITIISCSVTVLSASAAGCYAPPQQELTQAWNIGAVAYNTGITVYTTAFAIAPMLLAPFSEINGRRNMFLCCKLVFIVTNIGCAVTNSFAGMLVARVICGAGSSFFSTMVGGIISDIYRAENRNTPMAIFSMAALFGTGLGPLYASMVVKYTSWRWIYYAQSIAGAVLLGLVLVFFKETRGSVVLSRKAKALNEWYQSLEDAGHMGVKMPASDGSGKYSIQRIRWKVKSDEERESLLQMLRISLYRPFHLLFTEPVVFFFSLWVAFSWAVLYLQFGSIPLVFKDVYGFEVQQTGAVFTSMCVGTIIAFFISISHGPLARWFKIDTSSPESRLYFVCVESILMPIGLFWFGWTAFSNIHWISPALAVGCATIGIFSIYLAVFNYLADTYHRYASSALAAQSCCRNLLGGAFPLVTTALFRNMGIAEASSLLGGIGTALTIVPWVLVFWGPQIRARSKIASEIINTTD